MRKISDETMLILKKDKRMKKCCMIPNKYSLQCNGRIEWHHNLIYAGKQCDWPETILPLCTWHHRYANQSDIKERLDWIMLNQMSDEQIKNISKARDYDFRKNYLNTKFAKRK